MASFSPFWAVHYKDIGFCCILWLLQSKQVIEGNKIIEFIDTDWMDSKKLKWIGWDKRGYYAWIDSDGTVYNFSDLKRNDTGKEYESTKGRIKLPNDGNPDNSQAAISTDFYEYELSILKRCGFCPGPAGPSDDDSENSADSGGGKKAEEKDNAFIPSWQGLAQGVIPDYTEDVFARIKNVVTNSSDVTYAGYVTGKGNVTTPRIYGGSYGGGADDGSGSSKGDNIPKIPYSGLVPLPVDVPTPQPMPNVPVPKLPNPVIDKGVLKTPAIPAKKNPQAPDFKWDPPTAPQMPKMPMPGSVGSYNPTPTVPVKPLQPQKPPKYSTPTNQNKPQNVPPVKIPDNIKLGTDAKKEATTQHTINVLEDIMRESGNPSIVLNSTQRSPENQARVMLENIQKPDGVNKNLKLYGPSGDKVVRIAANGLKAGLSKEKILKEMTKEIYKLGPQRVSKHTGDPEILNVIDVSKSSLKNIADFINVATKHGIRVIIDNAVHLEIPQPK